MKVLVTGGAGYIGSHMVKLLLSSGFDVVVMDDLSGGFRDAVVGGEFVFGDVGDRAQVERVLCQWRFDAIMHFASFIQVGESVAEPAKYYRNNLAGTVSLLDAAVARGVRYFVFSSSAAIFGEPRFTPIDEDHPTQPLSPYGFSKLAVERMLADYDRAYGLRSVCLRYFNAAGADPDGLLGERHEPETHLIPLVLRAAGDSSAHVKVFGDDYRTPDGTCVRDYVHVADLCQAHALALDWLERKKSSVAFNLGNGNGFSVNEVIATARRVTNLPINVQVAARRAGDPAVLVADSAAARRDLGWAPQYDSLETIVQHAWAWEKKRRHGDISRLAGATEEP